MKHAESILVTVSILVAFVSWLSSTFKSGYLAYSPWSLLGNNHPRYKIARRKVKQFVASVCVALLLNVVLAMMITRSIVLIAEFSLFNMFFLSYSLVYFVLLEEKVSKE